jgi:glutaminase
MVWKATMSISFVPHTFVRPIQEMLDDLHTELRTMNAGALGNYIPELAKADPSWFGLAMVTLDGYAYATGDSMIPFTIQSVSKPFVYALALADKGMKEVLDRIGVEPTGEAFNAIRLESGTGRPYNPMVNTGAIVAASLVRGSNGEERFDRILEGLSAFAGRELTLDERMLQSERSTADHNRALAYLMRSSGALDSPVESALDVYFRQCSLLVTAHDLAIMAATLANGGVNPRTGRTVVDRETAEIVLTVMATCGTYDYAGEWMLRAGLPAKTGISGGLTAASPSRLGIGIFSPLLDERGNSIRALVACQELSRRLGLHIMRLRGAHSGRALRGAPR